MEEKICGICGKPLDEEDHPERCDRELEGRFRDRQYHDLEEDEEVDEEE